jgi:hypothetical protein
MQFRQPAAVARRLQIFKTTTRSGGNQAWRVAQQMDGRRDRFRAGKRKPCKEAGFRSEIW